jgi:hypothetical protein
MTKEINSSDLYSPRNLSQREAEYGEAIVAADTFVGILAREVELSMRSAAYQESQVGAGLPSGLLLNYGVFIY